MFSLQHRQNDNVGDTRLEGEEDLSSLRKEIADLQEVCCDLFLMITIQITNQGDCPCGV